MTAVGLTLGALAVFAGLRFTAPPFIVGTAAAACTTTVAWRRASPARAAVVALTAVLAYQRLSHDTQGAFEPLAVVLTIYTATRALARRRLWFMLAGLLAYALAVAIAIDAGSRGFSAGQVLLNWVPLAVLPAAAGLLVERHSELNSRLATALARLRDEQLARARQAAALERTRVARELHDVVAHSVSVMVIQAGAARLVAADDLQAARTALELVVSSGREALGDLRRVMGVLRRDDLLDSAQRPGLARLDRLIEPIRAIGLDIDLHVEGQPFPLPAEADLVAYRVVQEALTNTTKHAVQARAAVRIRYQADSIDLEVTDTGRGRADGESRVAGSGHGLIGMRERVTSCGGRLETGPRDLGGYLVHAILPVPPDADRDAAAEATVFQWPDWLQRWSNPLFAVFSLAALETAVVSYGGRHGWIALNSSLAAAISAACLWRRRLPLLFLAVVAGLGLAMHGLAPVNRATVAGTYVLLVPAYTLGAWASRRQALLGACLWLAGSVAVGAARHSLTVGLLAGALMAGLGYAAGRLVRRQREIARRLRETTDHLTAEREIRAELAVAEERATLARQLRNQVAQLIVAMVVQAEVTANALDGPPDAAVDALSAIETTGREALAQMRQLLGVLRAAPASPERRPQPGLAQLQTLIDRSRHRGQDVKLTVSGDPATLTGSVDLAAYRIIEEALRISGPTDSIGVLVRYRADCVEVELNTVVPAGSQWPSDGIRERVALCLGDLATKADGVNRTRLLARLPRLPEGALT